VRKEPEQNRERDKKKKYGGSKEWGSERKVGAVRNTARSPKRRAQQVGGAGRKTQKRPGCMTEQQSRNETKGFGAMKSLTKEKT